MILVDIYVPIIDKSFDFRVNENADISNLIEEVGEIIAQKEGFKAVESFDNLFLFDSEKNQSIDRNSTLRTLGIEAGAQLVLI